ncbi:MAG: efflux transporter outer membrane subunit [Burkholderiaceae bacterium]|nr:efflux transporter outer membrane subunit [Burkholderiaceae bacterium]
MNFSRSPVHSLTTLSLALLLGACAVTKVDPPKPLAAPLAFKETGEWEHSEGFKPGLDPAQVPDDWWTVFNDPVLNDLQKRLVIGNENLKQAMAQVASARAVVDASTMALFPTLTLGASGTRAATAPSNTAPTAANPSNTATLSATAGWEVDVWGRLQQALSGAQLTLQANVNDLAAVRLSAQATLTQSYFSLRATEGQVNLYKRTVEAYQRSLRLTQDRFQDGVAARTDVLQAQTQLETAQAQLHDYLAQRAQLEHSIAVMLGLAPSELTVAESGPLPPVPEVPVQLPSRLLERRPDIAAARSQVQAAYYQIGVADAAFFPSINLAATAGYSAKTLTNLTSAPNLFWSLGPSMALQILDSGQLRLASAQARATADQLTSVYRQTVLTAFQEVEDNLALATQLEAEVRYQQQALQAAQQNLELTLEQYRYGTVSYLNVITAQTTALSTESTLLTLKNRQLAAVNLLLKNIAGRWERA